MSSDIPTPPKNQPPRPIAPMPETTPEAALADQVVADIAVPENQPAAEPKPAAEDEIGGPKRLEPTRFGDWEKNGRCVDF